MAIKKRIAPQLEPVVFETVWPGDDAIDLSHEKSDLAGFCIAGGDPSFLQVRIGATPARIQYRALKPRERDLIAVAGANSFREACRYGLISIAGMSLGHTRFPTGVTGLSDDSIDELSEITTKLNFWLLVNPEAEHDHPKSKIVEAVDLAQFLGVLIISRSFQDRDR